MDLPYPGIRPEITTDTPGVSYRDLDAESLAILDEYDDSLYQRSIVHVRFSSGKVGEAMAYVLLEKYSELMTDEPWDLDQASRRLIG
jgi:hypothetical protein